MPVHATNGLKEASKRIRNSPFALAAATRLAAVAGTINDELRDMIIAEIPAFTISGNPDVLPELGSHAPEHTAEIIRLLNGGVVGDFEFVRRHARRRAEQRFPLEATLHAYRCGHRVFSRWLHEFASSLAGVRMNTHQLLTAVADFTLEYADAVSTVAAAAYVAHTRMLADVAGDERAELIRILLDGYDESDGRVAKILRQAGFLDQRQSFCVVLAQAVDPAEMLSVARARRIAEALEDNLRRSSIRHLVDVRDNRVAVVLSAVRRTSGWTAPRAKLAHQVAAVLARLGNAVVIGISNDVPSTSRIPGAYRQALVALERANVAERIVEFSAISTRDLLVYFAGDEMRRTLPVWTAALFALDRKLKGALIASLGAYADADMNVLKAAAALSVHPNTIYSRFEKISDITGLDPRAFHALGELLLVIDCWRE